MEQILLYIILAAAVLSLTCSAVTLILVATKMKNVEKTISQIAKKTEQIEKISGTKAQSKEMDGIIADIKTASASAVSEQMKHELKEVKQMIEKLEKTVQKQSAARMDAAPQQAAGSQQTDSFAQEKEDLDKTMVIPKIEVEKKGSILCRKCYKAYSSAETECPYCKTKR